MTDIQTEARAIAERLTDYGLTLDPNVVICDRRVVDEAAAALAAKDAELAVAVGEIERLKNLVGDPQGTVDHAEAFLARAERAEAQLAEANRVLNENDRLLAVIDLDSGSEHDCLILETLVAEAKARRAREAQGGENG